MLIFLDIWSSAVQGERQETSFSLLHVDIDVHLLNMVLFSDLHWRRTNGEISIYMIYKGRSRHFWVGSLSKDEGEEGKLGRLRAVEDCDIKMQIHI